MRHTMKMTLAALTSLAFLPTAASAVTVKAPYPGTVVALTYSSTGAFHGAVDIASGSSCNYWGVGTGLVGSFFWNITINTSINVCYGNGSGNQNEAKHVFSDGRSFRLWHFNKTTNSYDRTCDRCLVGDEGGTGNVTGPLTHLQADKSGTKDTSWYEGYVVKGQRVDGSTIIGVL